MSRSYKRTPVSKDGHSGKEGKKFANRKVRRYKKSLPNGKAYKKVFDSWDIHDCVTYYSYQSFKKTQASRQLRYEQGVDRFPYYSKESTWFKSFKRK